MRQQNAKNSKNSGLPRENSGIPEKKAGIPENSGIPAGLKSRKKGRPRRYAPTELELFQKRIDDYFVQCEAKKLMPTVTELALALDFTSRQALLNYEGKPEFEAIIKRAKLRVEAALQRRLGEPYPTGAIFDLKNNFGWKDISGIEHTGPGGEPLELGNLELAARILSILALAKQRMEAEQKAEALPRSEDQGQPGTAVIAIGEKATGKP